MIMKTLNTQDRVKINKVLAAVQAVRNLDAEMPLGQLVFFLTVAKNEGAPLREIAAQCDMLMGTASRYMSNLQFIPRYRQQAGVSLIEAFDNPADRRQKVIVLTPAGRTLLEDLTKE
jgi:DNA-binding MarR family transcriptional regulator